MTKRSPFRYFKTNPEIIRLAVMLYVRFPLSLRSVEDLLHERGIDVSHETVRFWWDRFGPMFAAEIRRQRVSRKRSYSNWQWHLDEGFVKINGERHYLWRAVDHEGEVLESFVTKRRDRKAALKFLKKSMKRHGRPHILVTDKLRSYGAAIEFNRQVAFETGDLALVQNGWTLTTSGGDKVTGVSVEVARKQSDGTWKYAIDSPDGAALLHD